MVIICCDSRIKVQLGIISSLFEHFAKMMSMIFFYLCNIMNKKIGFEQVINNWQLRTFPIKNSKILVLHIPLTNVFIIYCIFVNYCRAQNF